MAIRLTENFRALFYAPFYATHALGFYAREGVEVDLLGSPAPGAAALMFNRGWEQLPSQMDMRMAGMTSTPMRSCAESRSGRWR